LPPPPPLLLEPPLLMVSDAAAADPKWSLLTDRPADFADAPC
jgi:hypothetical protein